MQKPAIAAVESGVKPEPIVHTLEPMKKRRVTVNLSLIIMSIIVIGAGGLTGMVLAKSGSAASSTTSSAGAKSGTGIKKVVGVADEKTFKDNAEGILREGGTDKGEGTHYIERPGGISQNVYLTSSTIPLSDYVSKHVKVWGETFSAQEAGWFMDVGRLELLE